MTYVFDNSPLSTLFRNFYPNVFKMLWQDFDQMVSDGRILSTREVLREIDDSSISRLQGWSKDHQDLFPAPTSDEGAFVAQIYAVPHFQQNIERQKLLKGGRNADPFVIARARVLGLAVVTQEQFKPNGTKIPNICHHFGIDCLTLEEFMEREGWIY